MSETSPALELALFPLRTVLFPGGLLTLKVFEARYLDLISACMREGRAFGVVALRQGGEVHQPDAKVTLEETGTLAELIDVDSAQPGILNVRCRGTQRFKRGATRQQSNGLWVAQAALQSDDAPAEPEPALLASVRGLESAVGALKARGSEPFLEPFCYDQAGWVANRWCELLPISLAAKQKLLELDDPHARLRLVHEFLRSKGVVEG